MPLPARPLLDGLAGPAGKGGHSPDTHSTRGSSQKRYSRRSLFNGSVGDSSSSKQLRPPAAATQNSLSPAKKLEWVGPLVFANNRRRPALHFTRSLRALEAPSRLEAANCFQVQFPPRMIAKPREMLTMAKKLQALTPPKRDIRVVLAQAEKIRSRFAVRNLIHWGWRPVLGSHK